MTNVSKRDSIISALKATVASFRTGQAPDCSWDGIEDYKERVQRVSEQLCKNRNYYCERLSGTNNIILRSTNGSVHKTYNIICTDTVTFSGTIGITEVEKDGGVDRHLEYLRKFTDNQADPLFRNKLRSWSSNIDYTDPEHVLTIYKNFYENLKCYFETYPLAMYSLMTGIKEVYNLPSDGIIISPNGHTFVNFDNFKSIDLINRSQNFTYETSDTVPCLKIYYEGTKLMHLRTKIDRKNQKFKLRFFMETGKNFFKVFEDFSGDIKNEF